MALTVFLHGLGGCAVEMIRHFEDFASVEENLCLAINGFEPCGLLGKGRQWFPFTTIESEFSKRAAKAAASVADHVNNLKYDGDIVLVGHSQGGMVAAQVILGDMIAGARAICVSTTASLGDVTAPERLDRLTFIHGTDDNMIACETTRQGLGKWPCDLAARFVAVTDAGHLLESRLVQAIEPHLMRRHWA